MTTLERLDQLLALIDRIAQYEIGNPEVPAASYASSLEIAASSAEEFGMGHYATQCQEKLEDLLGDHEPGQRLPEDAAERAASGSAFQGEPVEDEKGEIVYILGRRYRMTVKHINKPD